MENPNLKWMMTEGSPIFGNHNMGKRYGEEWKNNSGMLRLDFSPNHPFPPSLAFWPFRPSSGESLMASHVALSENRLSMVTPQIHS